MSTQPKPQPLGLVRRIVYGDPGVARWREVQDIARAHLALVEAARPFARCGGKLWPCPGCAGCRLAALLPEDNDE